MNTITHPASVELVRTMMRDLPFPVKDLFIIGYSKQIGAQRDDAANPFRSLFALMNKLDEDLRTSDELFSAYSRKHNKAQGTPPRVAMRNAELDERIKSVICEIRAVLRPEHQGVLDCLAARQFFVAVSKVDFSLRQIRSTMAWNAAEFKRQQNRIGGAK